MLVIHIFQTECESNRQALKGEISKKEDRRSGIREKRLRERGNIYRGTETRGYKGTEMDIEKRNHKRYRGTYRRSQRYMRD